MNRELQHQVSFEEDTVSYALAGDIADTVSY
jgi:hypothetical protein